MAIVGETRMKNRLKRESQAQNVGHNGSKLNAGGRVQPWQ